MDAIKNPLVIMKLVQTAVGFACFGIIIHKCTVRIPDYVYDIIPISRYTAGYVSGAHYLALATFAILVRTVIEIIAFLVDNENMKKSFSVVISSFLALILYFTASVTFSTQYYQMHKYKLPETGEFIPAIVLGFLNSFFYLGTSLLAFKAYKSG